MIVDYLNDEFEYEMEYEDFDRENPNLESIGLAYTTSEDGEHEIQAEYDLVNYKRNTFVDGELANIIDFRKDNSEVEALELIVQDLMFADFSYFTEIDRDEYFKRIGKEFDESIIFWDENSNLNIKRSKNYDYKKAPDSSRGELSEFKGVYMVFDNLLYCSLNVINDKGSIIANQFIVGIDKGKEAFKVFCENNPGAYKFYDLPFTYIGFVDREIDGSFVKLVRHKKATIEKKLKTYSFYLQKYNEKEQKLWL